MEKADKKYENKGGGGKGGLKTIKNASTQVIYQKPKKEEKKDVQKPKKNKNSMKNNNHGQIIGKDPEDDRWQCKICSFKNPQDVEICITCDSKKGEEKQKR